MSNRFNQPARKPNHPSCDGPEIETDRRGVSHMSDYDAHVAEVINQVPEADPEKVAEAFARYEKDFLDSTRGCNEVCIEKIPI